MWLVYAKLGLHALPVQMRGKWAEAKMPSAPGEILTLPLQKCVQEKIPASSSSSARACGGTINGTGTDGHIVV